jgi:hypothetical protein
LNKECAVGFKQEREMVKDILSKLDAELRQEITSERQVVYILVQIRKLIDSDKLSEDFEALKLHCDWAVHPKLNKSSAKRLLRKLNDRHSELRSKSGPQEAMSELSEKLGLQAFQVEFHKFLQFYNLNESSCDGNWWFAFLYHYSRVIQDCPLEGVAPDSGWEFDRVVLVDPDLTVSPERLYIQWEFLLGEQQVGLWIIHQDRDSLGRMRSTSSGSSTLNRLECRPVNWKTGFNRLVVVVAVGLVFKRIFTTLRRRNPPAL